MPRLPSSANVPQVQQRSDPGLSMPGPAPIQAFESGIGQFAEEFAPALDAFSKAQERLFERRAVLDRVEKRRTYQSKLKELSDGLLATDGEIPDEDLISFGQQAREVESQVLAAHNGTAMTRQELAFELGAARDEVVGSLAQESTQRSRDLLETEIGRDLSALAIQVSRDPNSFGAALRSLDTIFSGTDRVFGRADNDKRREEAVSMLTEMSIDRMLTVGGNQGIEEAIDILGNPMTQRLLTPAAVKSLTNQVNRAEQKRIEAANRPRVERNISGIPESIWNQLTDREQRQRLNLLTAEEKGEDAANQKKAEARALLGVDELTDEQRQELFTGRPLVEITNEGESALAKQLGQNDANTVTALEASGQSAIGELGELARLDAALDSGRFTTGVFADARRFMSQLATFVGADPETMSLLGDAATADTLDAASKRLAVDLAGNMGRVTNMSLGVLIDSLPGLTRTPEGNRILLATMRRGADRRIEHANLANEYIQRFGTLRPEGERTYYQAVSDLEKTDPVITSELRDRIINGGKSAPRTFGQIFGGDPPPGVNVPPGFEYERQPDGSHALRRIADGAVKKIGRPVVPDDVPTLPPSAPGG